MLTQKSDEPGGHVAFCALGMFASARRIMDLGSWVGVSLGCLVDAADEADEDQKVRRQAEGCTGSLLPNPMVQVAEAGMADGRILSMGRWGRLAAAQKAEGEVGLQMAVGPLVRVYRPNRPSPSPSRPQVVGLQA